MTNPLLGIGLHGVGALSSSLCYTPQKKTRAWSWQTYWMAQAAVCWLLLPAAVAALTVPHLGAVLAEAPRAAMLHSFLLGLGYVLAEPPSASPSVISASPSRMPFQSASPAWSARCCRRCSRTR